MEYTINTLKVKLFKPDEDTNINYKVKANTGTATPSSMRTFKGDTNTYCSDIPMSYGNKTFDELETQLAETMTQLCKLKILLKFPLKIFTKISLIPIIDKDQRDILDMMLKKCTELSETIYKYQHNSNKKTPV